MEFPAGPSEGRTTQLIVYGVLRLLRGERTKIVFQSDWSAAHCLSWAMEVVEAVLGGRGTISSSGGFLRVTEPDSRGGWLKFAVANEACQCPPPDVEVLWDVPLAESPVGRKAFAD